MLTVKAPAKINLTLEVLGKRPDGYHEIRSVLQTLDLHAGRMGAALESVQGGTRPINTNTTNNSIITIGIEYANR